MSGSLLRLTLAPRYPLVGGWKTSFETGYRKIGPGEIEPIGNNPADSSRMSVCLRHLQVDLEA